MRDLIRRIPAIDLGLAAAFATAITIGTILVASQSDRSRELDGWALALVAFSGLIVVTLHRTAPVWGLAGAVTASSLYLLAGYSYGPVQLCLVVGVFELARQRPLRDSALICALAALAASVAATPRFVAEAHLPLLIASAWTSWVVLPWSFGALVRLVGAARRQAREELMARAAAAERTRLAEDVHDIAGHGFAVVAMQAGVALLTLEERPEQARTSLEAIKSTASTSLTELRGMLNTLHAGGESGLDRVDELVDDIRASGVPVELHLDSVSLPTSIDVVAYRVIQEGLTNVLRHAGPTTAEVRLTRCDTEIVLQVLDHGRARPDQPPAPGRGLSGMRRRVEAVGGRLETGARDGGGFEITARLPLAKGDA